MDGNALAKGVCFTGAGKKFFSYQHANNGDEGDDLGEPPKGKEETTQHFGDGISVKLCDNANWRLSMIRLQSLGFGCSALCQCGEWERVGRRRLSRWSPSWRAQRAGEASG